MEKTTCEEFIKKNPVGSSEYSYFIRLAGFYELVGVLVKYETLNEGMVLDMFALFWNKVGPLVKGMQKTMGGPNWFENYEYLATRALDEINLKPTEVELLEDCEMVTNLIIGQVLGMIESPEMKNDILWLQKQHTGPNKQRWTNIVKLTEQLWGEAGGGYRVKKYHSVEEHCKAISDEEIFSIDDPEARETVMKIKHIHDNTLERITRIATKCYLK